MALSVLRPPVSPLLAVTAGTPKKPTPVPSVLCSATNDGTKVQPKRRGLYPCAAGWYVQTSRGPHCPARCKSYDYRPRLRGWGPFFAAQNGCRPQSRKCSSCRMLVYPVNGAREYEAARFHGEAWG